MTLRDLQPDAVHALDAVIARAEDVVEPVLLALVTDRIAMALTDSASRCIAVTDRERAVCAVIDQELIDVAGLDDATVQHAVSFFPDGHFADLLMASYAIEARMRLQIAAARLLGGLG